MNFGHGLSYTSFEYSKLEVPDTIKEDENIPVAVQITNTGDMKGDEVVQLYVSHDKKQYKDGPKHSLIGFKRINLEVGETKKVSFTVTPKQYAIINSAGREQKVSGAVQIYVGGKQPDENDDSDTATTKHLNKIITLN